MDKAIKFVFVLKKVRMPIKTISLFALISLFFCFVSSAQHVHEGMMSLPKITGIEPQPLLAQALRLKEALSFLGSSLSKEDESRLQQLGEKSFTPKTVEAIQAILDPYCLAMVNINPEARVKVVRGPAPAKLMQNGWT